MNKRLALMALLALGACHRPRADQPSPGADGEARAQTAAKTIADLQAADDASRGPAPEIAPPLVQVEEPRKKVAAKEAAPAAEAASDETAAEVNSTF